MHDQIKQIPLAPRRAPWNKGKLNRSEACAPTAARLVDPDQVTGRGTGARLGDIQPGYRQQTAWL